ncbi:6,7-dimethyl-8-ribityllumazine synthase [Candidatus Uhrbacteria bacterium]|nr:6,7-dimethyl-8-ribityllumazine synthase [Candidatus Uhrbacteria bacterium]
MHSNTYKHIKSEGVRAGIVRARFNEDVTGGLLDGAHEALVDAGVKPEDITLVEVPGSLEIPTAASILLEHKTLDVVVTLGCIVKGETAHDEYIATSVYQALVRLAMHTGVPITMGILTVNTIEQARARSGTGGMNRGREAALSGLEMVQALKPLKTEKRDGLA